jgi:hypothetical protein
MTNHCDHSAEVLRLAQTGAGPELIEHLATCEVCVDALVAHGLRAQVEAGPELNSLPYPDLIWFKAEAICRRESLERAMTPLATGSILAGTLGSLGTAGLLGWLWSGFRFETAAGMAANGLYAGILVVGVISVVGLSIHRIKIG